MQSFDKQLGYVPAIPEPFWYKSWCTLFRYKPACYQCGKPMLFKTIEEWERHYVLTHLQDEKEVAI